MSEFKGEALLKASGRIMKAAAALLLARFIAGFTWHAAVAYLALPVNILVGAAAVDIALVMSWNVSYELKTWYAEREERSLERARRQITADIARYQGSAEVPWAPAVLAAPVRTVKSFDDGVNAINRARSLGTYSVNGVRRPGPPPAAYVHEWRTETPDGVTYGREEHVPGRGSRVSKSECDACGALMDVAWCRPGVTYLCADCRMGI